MDPPAAGSLYANGSTALDAISALNTGDGTRWTTLMLLSAAAIICLPRQFQVAVVENRSESHITVASWLFPAYLFLLTLAAVPIAAAGLIALPAGAEPDLYVLTLPLARDSALLALAAFVGGLSAATSMVIVASLALAVMISNHLVAPLLVGRVNTPGGVGAAVLVTRRVAIAGVIGLGTLYAEAHGAGGGLASIGLIAFAGVAQFAPALIAGLFWRRANRYGATAGLATGAAIWVAVLLMPSFGVGTELVDHVRAALLPPDQLFGPNAVDPLVFGVTLSIAANVIVYVLTSLATSGSVIDELQATVFVDALRRGGSEPTLRRSASRRELMRLARRILGPQRADEVFAAMRTTTAEEANSALIAQVERELAFAVGTSSAHTLVMQIATGEPLAVDAAITLLQETQEAIEAARALDIRSVELERTTAELANTNASLKALLAEKDDFLSRVSHEMRTPVTAVRSFAELLREGTLTPERAARFVDIILEESRRLSRLLDDILDLSRLEAGVAPIRVERIDAAVAISEAAAVMDGFAQRQGASIRVAGEGPVYVRADADRLKQVLVNLLSNAIKFCGDSPVEISVDAEQGVAVLRVRDHGPGIAADVQPRLFGKFISGTAPHGIRGAGLGLAISRQIMRGLGGSLALETTGPGGSCFAARLPLAEDARARLAS